METKNEMYFAGQELLHEFCSHNAIQPPIIEALVPTSKLYSLATCAFYRPKTIRIMVPKCAAKGYGGRAWSWPGYVIDRTPFGVLQHELGHHVDALKFKDGEVFSKTLHSFSQEPPLTGYLGTDKQALTFYMEWFAENFRLFVTNPALCQTLRPKFFQGMLGQGFKPLVLGTWEERLQQLNATPRIVAQARKKISARLQS